MPTCNVCHRRVTRGEPTCSNCGETARGADGRAAVLAPTARIDDDSSVPTLHATDEGPATDSEPVSVGDGRQVQRSRHVRRGRLVAAVGALAVALVIVGVYVTRRAAGPGIPDGAAHSLAKLASDPGARWQRPLSAVVPALGCSTPTAAAAKGSDVCFVVDNVVLDEAVIVVVQKGSRAQLVGLAREDGTVRWRRTAPAGSIDDCLAVQGRLWCLSTRPFYRVVVADRSDDDGPRTEISPPVAGAYRGAFLSEIRPRTGTTVRRVAVPGSAISAHIGGVGRHGLYVVAAPTGSRFAVLRYSERGNIGWSRSVTALDSTKRFVFSGASESIRVTERDGRSYVSGVQTGNRQAVFDNTTGAPIDADTGHVVAVIGKQVVTQQASGGLVSKATTIRDNVAAHLLADDHSSGDPLMTTYVADQGSTSDPQGSYTIRSTTAPTVPLAAMTAEDAPVAFCDGVVTGHASRAVSGYDGRTGRQLWRTGLDAGPYFQVLCDGSKVVVADGTRVTAYGLRDGAKKWSVALPTGSRLTGGGFGDPAPALVAGPGELAFGSSMPTITFVQ